MAAVSDPCEQLGCTEDEWCGEEDGVYGCFCDERHHRPNNESYGVGSFYLTDCFFFQSTLIMPSCRQR